MSSSSSSSLSPLYDQVRSMVENNNNNTSSSSSSTTTTMTTREERVEVNQRALIDKILARYASAGAVYRELLQNSNDADATVAEIYFCTNTNMNMNSNTTMMVTSVEYRNNGLPFRRQDWDRLKKIAEGNPDESKIGAFGVGAYTMFSICEEPIVMSGNQALAFCWKGDALWTKTTTTTTTSTTTTTTTNNNKDNNWTSFLLPSRDLYPLPDLTEFGQFLCASLTFTKQLQEIRVFVDHHRRLTITKTLVKPPSPVHIPKNSNWWKSDGANTTTSNGLFRLPNTITNITTTTISSSTNKNEPSLLESLYHIQVTLDEDTAAVNARYISAMAKTKIPPTMVQRMERVTKKKPPSQVEVQIFLNGQQEQEQSKKKNSMKKKNTAQQIIQSFSPRMGEGRIFIGFRTSQTTGLAAHLAAPFVPTVEREAMDLQDPTLRLFNIELLEFSGILMRLTLEHGMAMLGVEYDKTAYQRIQWEQHYEQQKQQQKEKKNDTTNTTTTTTTDDDQTIPSSSSSKPEEDNDNNDNKATSSRVWGFAKYMAKGVQKTFVKVVNRVEDFVDDSLNGNGDELIHPNDPRPLCPEEEQAIVLMQSFCPRQSTPDPTVGTALAEGFSFCLPDKAPPVLTKYNGVVAGDVARLPNQGMEVFCPKANVIRSVVYQNAQEYHTVIAQCSKLQLEDLMETFSQHTILEPNQLIRFLKWWVKYSKLQQNHSTISNHTSLNIKERIRFYMQSTTTTTNNNNVNDNDPNKRRQVFHLKDFLFYLDEDKFRINNNGGELTTTKNSHGKYSSIDTLPMPNTVLPKHIQDDVTVRTLTDASLKPWFEALPMEIWVDFISHHSCMNSGQPEDEKLRLQVLSTICQEYTRRNIQDQVVFGSFCESIFKERRCIPFDSTIPTSYCADCPSNLYLYSAELEAFDGIGNFHKVSLTLKHMGITDEFLVALGVRRSVSIDFLFANLDRLQWNDDPKPLIEYLRQATLTSKDITKLKSTQYLPCENDISRMYAPNELYLPDRELRIFPFVRLLQWPSQDEITDRSLNGRFLVQLGMNVLPPLIPILKHIAEEVDNDQMRIRCLQFVSKKLGSGGAYQDEYERIGKSEKMKLTFLPCLVISPLDGGKRKKLYSVLTCCSEERCSVMGFPVIDPDLGDTGKQFANVFCCVKEPGPAALIQQLLSLVSTAKQTLRKVPSHERHVYAQKILQAFTNMFSYLSSRTSELQGPILGRLENEEFIPCQVKGEVEWFRPNGVFFKSTDENGDSVTESLFHAVEFSPFLAATGVKQEASTKDIFRLMIESPQSVLTALKTEERYRMFLRRIAAHRPFRYVTAEIRDSPFLLAYSVSGDNDDGANEKSQYELAQAKDIYIIDNSFFGRMFSVKRAPPESDLEEFYALVGSKYISKEVEKKFDVIGTVQRETDLTKALLDRIHERSPLLVSPSITSRPLVNNASSILDDKKRLELYEAAEIKAVYSLGKSVRSQKTTCCSQPGSSKTNRLYVTSDFDWFDVGYAIGELILQRCQLEDAFFISSLLEAPLEQLRARGFPVDRIIKTEPIPEPEPEPVESTVQKDGTGSTKAAQTTPDTASDAYAGTEGEDYSTTRNDMAGTSAEGPSSKWVPSQTSHRNDDSGTSPALKSPASQDDYVRALKQMFPEADETFIRNRLGPEPTMEQVQNLAEEMAVQSYPHQSKSADKGNDSRPHDTSNELKKANKFFGSKKLGRAFNGLRGSTFGGATGNGGGRIRQSAGNMAGPNQGRNDNGPVPPEIDASSHTNMEKLLQSTLQAAKSVDPNGVRSPEANVSIPEGLEKGETCEVIPGQDLNFFRATQNKVQVFSARKHPASLDFLQQHVDVVESFGVVLERLSVIFGLPLNSIAIFHDPTGGVIAFNLNRSLYFNVRFFYSLHYSNNLHQSRACYSYWYTTFCHEAAHSLMSGHGKEHGFYTESYVALYLPKVVALMAQMDI